MADYCKQDKEVDPTPSEDWMGSSVDPPCFGQSKIFLYTCLTKSPLTPTAMFQWEIQIEPSFSMENLQEVLTAFYSCFSLWKGLFFSGTTRWTFPLSSHSTIVGGEGPALYHSSIPVTWHINWGTWKCTGVAIGQFVFCSAEQFNWLGFGPRSWRTSFQVSKSKDERVWIYSWRGRAGSHMEAIVSRGGLYYKGEKNWMPSLWKIEKSVCSLLTMFSFLI